MSVITWLICAPVAAGEISGTVVALESGDPVSGVTVYAIDPRLGYAAATSGTDGTFHIDGLPDNPYRVLGHPPETIDHPDQYYPASWEYCDGRIFDLSDEPIADLTMALPAGARIQGRVLGPDGQPLEDASVEAEGVDGIGRVMRNGTLTDADGRFEIVGLSADSAIPSRYRLSFDAADLPEQYAGGTYEDDEAIIWDVPQGDVTDVGDLTLLEGITVTGHLEGPDGPVVGATVHVYASSQVRSVLSDEDGAYTAPGLPTGDVITWASLDGYGLTYYPDADRPGESVPARDEGMVLEGVDLTLPWEARLTGTLLGDIDDWSGASLLIYNDSYTVGIGGSVAEDGSFAIGRLHGGDYRVYHYLEDEGFLDDYLRGPDGERQVVSLTTGVESASLEITPIPGAVLEGLVTDDLGIPVYGAVVYATPDDDDLQSQAAVTDHDGAYRLDGLSAVTYTVEVYVTAYCQEDRGWVRTWWPGEVDELRASTLSPATGETLTGVDFELPCDDDHDGMGDAWERAWGLDPNRDDSAEDPDDDGYNNLEEYLLGTDPMSASADRCGCAARPGKAGAPWLGSLLLLLGWRRRA